MAAAPTSRPPTLSFAPKAEPWAGEPMIPGAWSDLPRPLATEFVARLDHHVRETPAAMSFVNRAITRLRARPLPFYPGWVLVEAQMTHAADGRCLVDVVYGPMGVVVVDGTSPPLHEANARIPLRIEDDATARDYLRFFCAAIHGADGPFEVVEHAAQLRLTGRDVRAARAKIAAAVAPITALPSDGEARVFEATVRYERALFASTFAVHRTGMVEMTDDTPLVQRLKLVLPAWDGPVRVPPRPAGRRGTSGGEARR